MKLVQRLSASILWAAMLSPLSGCGGGSDERVDGWALPSSYNLTSSGRSLDTGINGEGLFVLQDQATGQRSYSRLGRLDLNHEGQLIHADGSMVLGRSSVAGSDAAPLAKASLTMPARATTQVVLEGNLDSRNAPVSAAFNPSDWASHNFVTSLLIYTPTPRALTLYFRKLSHAGPDDWAVHASLDGRIIGTASALRFPENGSPVPGASIALRIAADDAAGPRVIAVDLGGLSQWASQDSLTGLRQDGYGSGVLAQGSVDPEGHLILRYDNGQAVASGQLVLARFTIADRLHRLGQSSWQCRQGCSPPMIGTPGSALLGTLVPATLNSFD